MERRKNLNDKFGFVDSMKIKDFIDYEQPNEYIVESDRYNSKYSTPVLTAGQSFILGYTNESKGVYEKGPCIIFDDFTTSVHYVDFPFKVKSSAMKILTTKSNADIKYCYYLLLSLSKMPPNHKRQWISTTSEKSYVLPSMDKQISIVKQLDLISDTIANYTIQIENLDNLVKARFIEMFGDPITNSRSLSTNSLKDTLILKAGDFTEASNIFEEYSDVHPYPCYGGNGVRGFVSEYNQDGEYSLIGRQGALSGNVQFVAGKFKNTEHALLVTPLISMNSIWLNQLLKNLDLKRYQTGAAQPGISVKNLQEIQIIMVPIAEQNKFANFVQQVDKSREEVKKSLEKTQQLYDSLMQEYFG